MATTFSFKDDGLKFPIVLKLFKATTWNNGVIYVFTTYVPRYSDLPVL